jgi:hypothetical protein
MTVSGEDLERLARVGESFVFSAPEPMWAPLAGDRSRAAARLLGFVAAVGLGTGLALWIVGDLVVTAIRAMS